MRNFTRTLLILAALTGALAVMAEELNYDSELVKLRRKFGYLKKLYLESEAENQELKRAMYGGDCADTERALAVFPRHKLVLADFMPVEELAARSLPPALVGKGIVFPAIYSGKAEGLPDFLVRSGYDAGKWRMVELEPPPRPSVKASGGLALDGLHLENKSLQAILSELKAKLAETSKGEVTLVFPPSDSLPQRTVSVNFGASSLDELLERLRGMFGLECVVEGGNVVVGPRPLVERYARDSVRLEAAPLTAKLRQLRLGKLEARDVPVTRLLRQIAEGAAGQVDYVLALDNGRKIKLSGGVAKAKEDGGDSFVMELGDELVDESVDVEVDSDGEPTPSVSLSGEGLSVYDALRQLCYSTGLNLSYGGENLVLVSSPAVPVGPLATERFTVSAAELCVLAGGWDAAKLKAYFLANGVQFPEGASLAFDLDERQLTVRDTSFELLALKSVLDGALSAFPVAVAAKGDFLDAELKVLEPKTPVKVYGKLAKLVVPKGGKDRCLYCLEVEALEPLVATPRIMKSGGN